MKIVHVLGTDRLSGAENVHLGILRSLKEGNEVVYASPDGPIRESVEAAGVRFLPCDTDDVSVLKRLYKDERPDVVHSCDPRISFKCALARIPFIAHLHCNCPWMGKFSPNSLALRYAVRRASAVIAVSDSIPEGFVFKKAFGTKLRVIPNVVDRERVGRMAAEAYDGEFDLIYVGRFSAEKRPLVFLNVVRRLTERLPHLTAAMVGDGDLRGEAERFIKDNGMTNVTLTGFDPNPYRIMARSKINVLTSECEGFGLSAVEGMILSKPIVAFPSGGITKIAESGGAICGTEDEMTEKLYKLLTDAEEYSRLSAKAGAASYDYTDTASYIGKITEIYEAHIRSAEDDK